MGAIPGKYREPFSRVGHPFGAPRWGVKLTSFSRAGGITVDGRVFGLGGLANSLLVCMGVVLKQCRGSRMGVGVRVNRLPPFGVHQKGAGSLCVGLY